MKKKIILGSIIHQADQAVQQLNLAGQARQFDNFVLSIDISWSGCAGYIQPAVQAK
jgi:hypothetical protein